MTERLVLPGQALLPRSAAVTVGTFDGVHRGHQAVLRRLNEVALERNLKSVVVTFEPHPLRIVRPEAAPRRLCTASEKAELLDASGVDQVAVVPFTHELAAYSPREFVERVLLTHFGLNHLVIGYDHGFGKDRSGDAATLQTMGDALGYGVTVVPHMDLDARPISTTRIRLLLAEGEVVEAAHALGRPYALEGFVIRGDGRGRELGFPTANLELPDPEKLLPAEGIYAVRVPVASQTFRALLHLGPRPTFSVDRATIEVYLLDFQGDLYGQNLRVELCGRIRGIDQFGSVDDLIEAMRRDVQSALRLFESGQGACS